jgi:stalled ribosome rescue protein Dom34
MSNASDFIDGILNEAVRPTDLWALVKVIGADDIVLSTHSTKEEAEKAMEKKGGTPNSSFQNGMRVMPIGPDAKIEIIKVMGKWTTRPK